MFTQCCLLTVSNVHKGELIRKKLLQVMLSTQIVIHSVCPVKMTEFQSKRPFALQFADTLLTRLCETFAC